MANAKRDARLADPPDVVINPTPTQEENDLAMMGATVMEKESDGSEPVVTPLMLATTLPALSTTGDEANVSRAKRSGPSDARKESRGE